MYYEIHDRAAEGRCFRKAITVTCAAVPTITGLLALIYFLNKDPKNRYEGSQDGFFEKGFGEFFVGLVTFSITIAYVYYLALLIKKELIRRNEMIHQRMLPPIEVEAPEPEPEEEKEQDVLRCHVKPAVSYRVVEDLEKQDGLLLSPPSQDVDLLLDDSAQTPLLKG